jgi:hypothetical protein
LSADLARLTRCLLRCRSGIQGGESRSSRCRRSPHDCRRIRADVSRSGGSFRVDRSGVASTCCRGCRQTRVSCDGSPFSRLHRPRAGLNCLRVFQHDPKVASHRSNPPQHGSAGEAQPAISDGTTQWGWGRAPRPGRIGPRPRDPMEAQEKIHRRVGPRTRPGPARGAPDGSRGGRDSHSFPLQRSNSERTRLRIFLRLLDHKGAEPVERLAHVGRIHHAGRSSSGLLRRSRSLPQPGTAPRRPRLQKPRRLRTPTQPDPTPTPTPPRYPPIRVGPNPKYLT